MKKNIFKKIIILWKIFKFVERWNIKYSSW